MSKCLLYRFIDRSIHLPVYLCRRSVCPSRLSVYMSVFLCWLSCDLRHVLAVYNMVYLCLVPSIRAWWPLFHILKQCRIWIRLCPDRLSGSYRPAAVCPKDLEYHAVPPDCPSWCNSNDCGSHQGATALYCEDKLESWDQVQGQDAT